MIFYSTPLRPLCWARLGTHVYFHESSSSGPLWLWKSDGTAAGTVAVSPVASSIGSCGVTAAAGVVFFAAYSGTLLLLHRTDGTAAGTFALPCIGAGGIEFQGRLYGAMSAPTIGTADYELWTSDGTVAGHTSHCSIQDRRRRERWWRPMGNRRHGRRHRLRATASTRGWQRLALACCATATAARSAVVLGRHQRRNVAARRKPDDDGGRVIRSASSVPRATAANNEVCSMRPRARRWCRTWHQARWISPTGLCVLGSARCSPTMASGATQRSGATAARRLSGLAPGHRLQQQP